MEANSEHMIIALEERRDLVVPTVFTLTIFTSASLLFFVQPMFAKMVLPFLGGSSAVWTTAMLFFQSTLILGYLYAHLSVKYLPQRVQVFVHMLVWALALVFLPIAIPHDWSYDPSRSAALQTLMLFAVGVGMPFAALSATAPLLQAWYARSEGPSANDPYFLYGASNLGSLLSLLAFPSVAEPSFGVGTIGSGWAVIYCVLGLGLFTSGLMMRPTSAKTTNRTKVTSPTLARVSTRQIAIWLFLAFLPSSLMLSTTSTIATDVGSFPLVWVIPLALYLLSFVVSFSGVKWPSGKTIEKLLLIFLIYSLFLFAGGLTGKLGWLAFFVLIAFFFVAAVFSHRRLYIARPAEQHLTTYYVTMSIGGALGGLFNSILAPTLFNDVYEGPVTLLACVFLLNGAYRFRRDLSQGLATGLVCAAPIGISLWLGVSNFRPFAMASCLVFFACFWPLRDRPLAVFSAAALIMLGGQTLLAPKAILKERSFFGTYAVRDQEIMRVLAHGTTFHGAEKLYEIGHRPSPVSYYFSTGPLAQLVNAPALEGHHSVGIVGLGVGALSCFRKPYQDWHYYEIDPVVDNIARYSGLFDYMPKCGNDIPTHIGDARLILSRQDISFDLLMIDAYSSDAIPVHLMTTEAVKIYLDRLADHGIIVFHISNRFFDFEPVLARIARDLDLKSAYQSYSPSPENLALGAAASQAFVMTRDQRRLDDLLATGAWEAVQADTTAAWTDDYSNLLSALR